MGSRALAAAQTTPVRGDVAANITQHLQLACLAATAHARVVVFPELSLTGYEISLAEELAFSPDDPRLGPLAELASSSELTLIVGAPVRIDAKLHIGAFILSPDKSIAIHTKKILGAFTAEDNPGGKVPPAEATVFSPGELQPLIACGDAPAAVAICAESLRPSTARDAAKRGAKTYLSSHFGIPRDLELRLDALGAYAKARDMAVVFANYGGPTGDLEASGGSAILSETGERLVQLGAVGSGVAIAREHANGWNVETRVLD